MRIVGRGLRLERNLLVDDDCGVGWYGWYGGSVDIALGAVGLLHQREDDEEDNQVEEMIEILS